MYGRDSAVSAAFGGGVPVVAGLVYGAVAALSPPAQAPLDALRGILRAESAKVLTVVVLLWMVFKFGAAMQPVAFFCGVHPERLRFFDGRAVSRPLIFRTDRARFITCRPNTR